MKNRPGFILRTHYWVTLVLLSIALYSCGSSDNGKVLTTKDMPEWVNSLPKTANTVYAIGTANIGANPVMARRKADEDARQEIGRIASSKLKSVLNNVMKENMDFLNSESKTQSSTEAADILTRSFSETVVSGIEIIDRWEDAQRNILYALAKIKSEDLKNAISSAIDSNAGNLIVPEKKEDAKKKVLSELEKFDFSK